MTAPTEPPKPRLRFRIAITSETAREVLVLDEGQRCLIGRSGECDVRVDDPCVSRRHARFHLLFDCLAIEDVGSANGTWVSQSGSGRPSAMRIPSHERVELRGGDVVQIGEVTIEVECTLAEDAASARDPKFTRPAVLSDPAMRSVYDLVQKVARRDIFVLVVGETGVGKQLVARTLHNSSRRCAGPFAVLSCATLPEAALERKLFGGAERIDEPQGLVEQAQGGTLFLDDIEDLPLALQPRLLSLLGEPVASSIAGRPMDVRVVAASRRPLRSEVRSGQFRADLYYRIAGVTINVPPLRDRPGEIEPLARHFLEHLSRAAGQRAPDLTPQALVALRLHRWPGNVRELRNVMERALLVAKDGVVDAAQLLIDSSHSSQPATAAEPDGHHLRIASASEETTRQASERERLVAVLDVCAGNQTRAAALLGISRQTFVKRLNKWGLPRPRKRDTPEQ